MAVSDPSTPCVMIRPRQLEPSVRMQMSMRCSLAHGHLDG
jgi:hypothetical protein